MNAEFGVSSLVATVGLSSFVFGLALGPVVTSPLSELYGRRPIYLASWTIFLLFSIPSAVAKNIETMIVTRFFAGFGGGTFLAVSGGTVADIFLPRDMQPPMALVSVAPFVGPCTGPVIGGFINYHLYWRWTYCVTVVWSFALLILIVVLAPETHHAIKLRQKARHLRRETGDERYRTPMEMTPEAYTPSAVAVAILRPFQLIAREPMCLLLNLHSAVLLAILYLFFLAFPIIFRAQYGMNLWQVGLTFLGIIAGMCVAATTPSVWSGIRERLIKTHGKSEPEHRLPQAMFGALLIPVGLFWFGWTATPNMHWIVPVLGSALFGCGFVLSAYPDSHGSRLTDLDSG